jgi:hypothetical protein
VRLVRQISHVAQELCGGRSRCPRSRTPVWLRRKALGL